ncbi:outer membrane beta-barrel protein [Ancylomarina longa]|uniref:PorT family protein n=1 Tax=Ancylomarina longa TaxID=2487017 RepID=A0A434AGB6_9BACT|nr:outer membrane beta-barrel protein [Ancylomarina longa]RUT73431.1 PorT family protein [Ancylomarina longa]
MSKPKINTHLLPLVFQTVFIISLVLIFGIKSNAQIAITAGGNYSNIRSNLSLENTKPITGYNFGISVQYYPFKQIENVSFINELNFSQKGYQQDLGENFTFRFNYLAVPVLINYSPLKHFSVQGGVEMSKLISTNVEQGKKTYNHFDLGLVLGLSAFAGRSVSFYSRVTYGLTPMLDYYAIDEMGNFTGEIHDLKNICLSIGIKFAISNEKIHFHH